MSREGSKETIMRVVVALCVASFLAFLFFLVVDLAELRMFPCERGINPPGGTEPDPALGTRSTMCTAVASHAEYAWSSQLLRVALFAVAPLGLGGIAGRLIGGRGGRSSATALGFSLVGILVGAFGCIRVLLRGAGAGWEEMSLYVGLAVVASLISALLSRGATKLAVVGPVEAGLAVALMDKLT